MNVEASDKFKGFVAMDACYMLCVVCCVLCVVCVCVVRGR